MEQEIGRHRIGQTMVPLVIRHGGPKAGVITPLKASFIQGTSPEISFLGPVRIDPRLIAHVKATLLPLVSRILDLLGVSLGRFEINLAVPSISTLTGKEIVVEETSLGAPLFVAMLSAALKISIPQDKICTGHILSIDGEIGPVGDLSEKFLAIRSEKRFSKILYPNHNRDASIRRLTPRTWEIHEKEIPKTGLDILARPISDVFDLAEEMWTDGDIVLGSVTAPFYSSNPIVFDPQTPVERVAKRLISDLPHRVWRELQSIAQKDEGLFREALYGFVDVHLQHQQYPTGMGVNLHNLFQSLPLSIQRKIDFGHADWAFIRRIRHLSEGENEEDVKVLLDVLQQPKPRIGSKEDPDCDSRISKEEALLSLAIQELRPSKSEEASEQQYWEAYRTFPFQEYEIITDDDLESSAGKFLTHIYQRIHQLELPVDPQAARSEGRVFLDLSYKDQGGWSAALWDAVHHTGGGLPQVFENLTRLLIEDRLRRYRLDRLQSIIKVDDFETPIALMETFKEKYHHLIPPNVREKSAEELAPHWKEVLLLLLGQMEKFGDRVKRTA